MILYPPAKINIGLYVTDRRADGYHNIETLFYPTGLTDILEAETVDGDEPGEITLEILGREVDGALEENLVIRAFRLLQNDFDLPAIRVCLYKQIPSGAGLGGGSSDGAAMLSLLDQLCHLGLGEERLRAYALKLGSDCPFFIKPQPSLARGRGELLQPVSIDLKG